MTLQYIIRALEQIAINQKNIRTATDGSIYEFLDNNPSVQYNVFHITQTTHRTEDDFDYYGFNLFFVGRLEDNLENNRLDLQSEGKEVITNILRSFCNNFDIELPTLVFYPFTQKFSDLTAGVYCNLEIEVPIDWLCEDGDVVIGDITTTGDTKLQYKNIRITSNGTTTVGPDMGYDGLYGVGITVEVPQTGYTEEDLDNSYRDGENYQKSKLTTLTATTNGTYTRADGYSAVTVEVEQSGQTFETQTLTATANGTYTPSSGYDGFNQVIVNVPQTGNTGYTSLIRYKELFNRVVVPDDGKNINTFDVFGNVLPYVSNTYDEEGILTYNGILGKIANSYFRWNEFITEVVLPEGLTVLDPCTFYQDTRLSAVTLPSTLIVIADGNFIETDLRSIVIPSNVALIGESSFGDCKKLREVTIYQNVETLIENFAFYGCSSLNSIKIHMYSNYLPHFVGNPFKNISSTGTLHLPQDQQGETIYNLDAWRTELGNGWSVRYDL